MHTAKDLLIAYEVDLIKHEVRMEVEWIDTQLIQRFLSSTFLEEINLELTRTNMLPPLENLTSFSIELEMIQEQIKTTFEVELAQRDFEPKESSLVIMLKR